MSGLRLALRLARRDMARRPWRTALVVLMVLVPTAAMAAVATLARTSEWPPADRLAAEVGRADLTAYPQQTATTGPVAPAPPVSDADEAALVAALPAGSRVVVEHRTEDRVRTSARRSYFTVSDVDLGDDLVAPRFAQIDGGAPDGPGEAVVSRAVADDLSLEVGDEIEPERLGRPLRVVGVVQPRSWPDRLVITPAPQPSGARSDVAWVDLPGHPYADLDGREPLGPLAPTVTGWALSPVLPSEDASKTEEVFWTYVGGGVALSVLGTVIAAAFAIAARRQLRTLGLLSAAGAAPATLRRFLVAEGATCGAVGSVAGILAGVGAVHLLPGRWLDSVAGRDAVGIVVRPSDLVPIAVIGTAAAAVAAWFPARSAAGVSTLQALAGRRPLGTVPARVPVLGAAVLGGGCALFAMSVAGARNGGSTMWALVAIAGGLACLFGAVAVCPWVVAGLERLAARWSVPARVAGRSLARNRVRSSAVMGAVVAVSAAFVAGTTLYASNGDAAETLPWVAPAHVRVDAVDVDPAQVAGAASVPVPPAIVSRLEELVPGARPLDVREAGADTGSGFANAWAAPLRPGSQPDELLLVGVATEDLLSLYDVGDDLRAALDDGAAVAVSGDGATSAATAEVSVPGSEPTLVERVRLAGVVESDEASQSLPAVLVSEGTARSLGLTTRPSPALTLAGPAPLTERQREDVRLLAQDLSWEANVERSSTMVNIQVADEPDEIGRATVRAGATALSLVLVAAVVAIGLALAAKDSEDERQVLTAVGAPPRTVRRVAAIRAAMLVAGAGIVAVPTGLLPAAAIVEAAATGPADHGLQLDPVAIAWVVLVAPVAVALAVLAGAAVRDRARPPRPAVFAFVD
ncbi:MAG TPA: FtsX-like permease family protein [Acidimicrobiales bacterium]